ARCAFFFQAEDGIRDFHVTGVQTCALPISLLLMISANACVFVVSRGVDAWLKLPMRGMTIEKYEERYGPTITLRPSVLWKRGLQIGRASCRGRGGSTGGAWPLRETSEAGGG